MRPLVQLALENEAVLLHGASRSARGHEGLGVQLPKTVSRGLRRRELHREHSCGPLVVIRAGRIAGLACTVGEGERLLGAAP